MNLTGAYTVRNSSDLFPTDYREIYLIDLNDVVVLYDIDTERYAPIVVSKKDFVKYERKKSKANKRIIFDKIFNESSWLHIKFNDVWINRRK